jgi:hypothetical protein
MTDADNLDTVKEETMIRLDEHPTNEELNAELDPEIDGRAVPDETGRPLEDDPSVRLERFRREHEAVTIPVEELEGFANDLIRQGYERGRAKVRKEPEVWTAADELSAVKYAQERGYITDLEAQRKVRKLLRLEGKAGTRRQAAPGTEAGAVIYDCKIPSCSWTSVAPYETTTGRGTRQVQTEKMQAADHRRTTGHNTREVVPCPDCEGTGYGILPRVSFTPTPLAGSCPRCDGSGRIGRAR